MPKLVKASITDQQQVFVAHSVKALPIDSGLVGKHHSAHQGYRVEVLPYVLRPFVHSQHEAYSVACAVAEVAFAAPQGLSCKGVNPAAGSPFRENGHREVYMGFQHQSIILYFQLGAFA